MARPSTINPRIIESLYCEALVLSDEVRAAFTSSIEHEDGGQPAGMAGLALSCEALRTTTRMMHAIAWLLNHRAYFAGELSELQLRRYGRLVSVPASEPANLALIDRPRRELIQASERFLERLQRIDTGWRNGEKGASGAIAALRERLGLEALR